MQPPFVKKFDFRGVYNKDIFDQDAYYLGLAIQKTIPLKKVLIGWDTRVASMSLALNFIHAFKNTGVDISYLESCPIDYVTASAQTFPEFDFSVMFTGSHNTWDWTGLLMHTSGGASVEGDLVTKIITQYKEVLQAPYLQPQVNILDHHNFQQEIEAVYKEKISKLIPLDKIKEMKVVVDIGDGSGSKALDVLEDILPQVTFARLNDRLLYNGETPHTADPSNIENMKQVIEQIKKEKYDCGFAFDSDADRVLAIDETGEYIEGSSIGSAMVEVFTSLQSDMKKFGYAVECGPAMYNTVVDLQKKGSDITIAPLPVGRSILRRMVREGKADIAVENVGHFYIKDFFQTDSGVFSLAIILYWISTHGNLSTVREKHPDGERVQFHKPREENQKEALQSLVDEITPYFESKKSKQIEVDGTRYEFFDGDYMQSWYATRPSGYEPVEKFYFGSLKNEEFAFLKEKLQNK